MGKEDLKWLIGSATRGFKSEVQIRQSTADKYAKLVEKARAAGGTVTIVEKGTKRTFSQKATGNAAFRGGPALGSKAYESFVAAGGRVKGTGLKSQGSLPKGVSAEQFGIKKLGMKTDTPSFRRRKRFKKNG